MGKDKCPQCEMENITLSRGFCSAHCKDLWHDEKEIKELKSEITALKATIKKQREWIERSGHDADCDTISQLADGKCDCKYDEIMEGK